MRFKYLLPFIAVAALAAASVNVQAADGRHKAGMVGLAAGVAAGAIGATILSNQSRAATPVAAPAPGYYAVNEPRYRDVPHCVVRPIELFDRGGRYVKTEDMRVCR